MTVLNEQPVDALVVSDYLGKSVFTVREYAKAGTIPGFKVGNEWRFFLSEVRDHLRQPQTWAQSPQARARRRRV